jgi:hypothetical protein
VVCGTGQYIMMVTELLKHVMIGRSLHMPGLGGQQRGRQGKLPDTMHIASASWITLNESVKNILDGR